MTFEPDEHIGPDELDHQIEKVEQSRKTSFKIQVALFLALMFSLLALVGVGFLLFQSWQETDRSKQQAAVEQVEKKQIAEETRKAICESGNTAIYDIELCDRLTTVASEPVQGNPGEQGPRGPAGQDGRDGLPGKVGPQGLRGMMGEIGRPGRDGKDGETIAGPVGPPGQDGLDGIDGQPGEPGQPGADSTVPGPQGEPGAPGADSTVPGPQGPAGPPGPAGADSTVPGPAGPPGATGPTGANGAQGVSIVDVDCIGDGQDSSWQITLSNGQILNGGGPCKTSNGGPELIPGVPGLTP